MIYCFKNYQALAVLLGVKIYFCDPYSSWQKGTVENTNKHLRKYIPKGSNLGTVLVRELREIEKKLKGRIMKILDYRTPTEAHSIVWAIKKRLAAFLLWLLVYQIFLVYFEGCGYKLFLKYIIVYQAADVKFMYSNPSPPLKYPIISRHFISIHSIAEKLK